jgi:hypothetical protein
MVGSLEAATAMLLACAGMAKIVAPAAASALLGRVWSHASTPPPVIRVAGASEVVIGSYTVVSGTRAAAIALAACYLAFAAITTRLLLTGQRAPCGCFGRTDADVGIAHLVVNLIGVAIAGAAAVRPPGALCGLLDAGALTGVVAAGQAVLLAYLGFLSVTALPALAAARRQLLEAR